MSFRIIAAFVIFLFSMRVNTQTLMPSEPLSKVLTIFELPPFERAVCCIRYYEGLHRKKDYPYVGYGHRLQPGERYSSEMTASEAEALLRKDLKELCSFDSGNRNIKNDYVKYCHWRGKKIASIERRRYAEFILLFDS